MVTHSDYFFAFGPLGVIASALIAGTLAAAWITAVVNDVVARRWLWLIADCVLPPIGLVRGLLVWFNLI